MSLPRDRFAARLAAAPLLADGGMGTLLFSRGIPQRACLDELATTRPDLIAAIHREYLDAGADLIETVTFGANRFRLDGFGLADQAGRFLVAGAGRLVARVLHVRERADTERVVVLDAGMTELVRPALYGAVHPVVALTSLGRPLDGSGRDAGGEAVPTTTARVDGPICESTDTLDRHDLPPVRRGDLVAIGEAGAYAASMAMAYNGRPVPAQALLEVDGSLTLGRRRRAVPYG